MKHIPERLRELRTQLLAKFAAAHQRKLEELSKHADELAALQHQKMEKMSEHPASKGWFYGRHNDQNRLYTLGTSIPMTPNGLQLGDIEAAYRLLKLQLQALDPQFVIDSTSPVQIRLDVYAAAAVLFDSNVLKSLKAVPDTIPATSWKEAADRFIRRLETTLSMDGDPVILQVVHSSFYEGFDFFVPGHPDAPQEGKVCSPSQDILALVAVGDARR